MLLFEVTQLADREIGEVVLEPIDDAADRQQLFVTDVEEQFRLFFKRAERQKGVTGENLLSMLERRLDNVVTLMGFSASRTHARQLITHGHFFVNDQKVNVPSFLVSAGAVVRFKDRSAKSEDMKALVASNRNKALPGWLEVDWDGMKGRVLSLPQRADITLPIEEHLIIELYSK